MEAAAESVTSDPAVPAEQSSAQEVASLATSVVLDLNESQPSLVNQSEGGDKVRRGGGGGRAGRFQVLP